MNSTAVYCRAFDTNILTSGLTNIKMHYSSTVSMQCPSHKLIAGVEALKETRNLNTKRVSYPKVRNHEANGWRRHDHTGLQLLRDWAGG